jgi:hypothetical protein
MMIQWDWAGCQTVYRFFLALLEMICNVCLCTGRRENDGCGVVDVAVVATAVM